MNILKFSTHNTDYIFDNNTGYVFNSDPIFEIVLKHHNYPFKDVCNIIKKDIPDMSIDKVKTYYCLI